jgi:hypothetical protein
MLIRLLDMTRAVMLTRRSWARHGCVRLVEGLALTIVGHGIILYLATIKIFPDRFVASMITAAVAAPAWAHWIMAGLFGLLGTFVLERFLWAKHTSAAYLFTASPDAARPDMKIMDAIDYIVNDSRAIFDKPRRPEPPHDFPSARMQVVDTLHSQAQRQLSGKINIGDVKAWGLREVDTRWPNKFESALKVIPLTYWEDMQVDFHGARYDRRPHFQTKPVLGRTATYNWTDVKVSRSQIETAWPKKSIVARLYNKILKRRVSYASEFRL